MPAYAFAATLYPPLDITAYLSQSMHRYIVPSPRLKFAFHAIADLSLSCLLVLIHGMCGSMESLLDSERRLTLPWGVRGAFLWYSLLAVWVISIIISEVMHCWRQALRAYEALQDEMSNPSVYHAKLKHRMDEKIQELKNTNGCVADPHDGKTQQSRMSTTAAANGNANGDGGPSRVSQACSASPKAQAAGAPAVLHNLKNTLTREFSKRIKKNSLISKLTRSKQPSDDAEVADPAPAMNPQRSEESNESDDTFNPDGLMQQAHGVASSESVQSNSTVSSDPDASMRLQTRPKKRRERRRSLWEISVAQKRPDHLPQSPAGKGVGGPSGPRWDQALQGCAGIRGATGGPPSSSDSIEGSDGQGVMSDPRCSRAIQDAYGRAGSRQPTVGSSSREGTRDAGRTPGRGAGSNGGAGGAGEQTTKKSMRQATYNTLRSLLGPMAPLRRGTTGIVHSISRRTRLCCSRVSDSEILSESFLVPFVCVASIIGVIFGVVFFGVFFNSLLTSIAVLAGLGLISNLLASSRHIGGKEPFLMQAGIMTMRVITDEPWRIFRICGRFFALAGLLSRGLVAVWETSGWSRENAVDEMYALGVLMALTRQVSLLHMIPGQSPFLILFTRFTVTLLNILFIMIVIGIGFGGGLFVLYYHQIPPNDEDCNLDIGSGTGLFGDIMMHMVQFGVNGEGDFACADSVTTVRTTATMMLALFILAVLILVNSLIAAMTKMFDEVWETQHVLVRCSRVMRLYQAEALKPLPPPFTLLSLPYRLYARCCKRKNKARRDSFSGRNSVGGGLPASNLDMRKARRSSAAKGKGGRDTGRDSDGGGGGMPQLRRRSTVEGYDDDNVLSNDFREGVGRTPRLKDLQSKNLKQRRHSGGTYWQNKMRAAEMKQGGEFWQLEEDLAKRALWHAWKASVSEEESIEHVLNYVSAREDEVLEEGLWRTRFARKVHEDAASTSESLAALRDSQRNLRETQAVLMKRQEEHNREVAATLQQLERLLSQQAMPVSARRHDHHHHHHGAGRHGSTNSRAERFGSVGSLRHISVAHGGSHKGSSIHSGASPMAGAPADAAATQDETLAAEEQGMAPASAAPAGEEIGGSPSAAAALSPIHIGGDGSDSLLLETVHEGADEQYDSSRGALPPSPQSHAPFALIDRAPTGGPSPPPPIGIGHHSSSTELLGTLGRDSSELGFLTHPTPISSPCATPVHHPPPNLQHAESSSGGSFAQIAPIRISRLASMPSDFDLSQAAAPDARPSNVADRVSTALADDSRQSRRRPDFGHQPSSMSLDDGTPPPLCNRMSTESSIESEESDFAELSLAAPSAAHHPHGSIHHQRPLNRLATGGRLHQFEGAGAGGAGGRLSSGDAGDGEQSPRRHHPPRLMPFSSRDLIRDSRISTLESPRFNPDRRKERANWLMNRPLEGRGNQLMRERQQQLNETNNRKSGLSSDEDESSSSSGGEEELEPLPPRLSNRAGAE